MSRLIRMLASLVILWVAYWLYSLCVVPFIEPPALAHARPTVSEGPIVDDRLAAQVDRLRIFFPPDAPELQNPNILESPNFSLLLKDYKVLADRRMEIKPCTLVFFPDGQANTTGGVPRAIIMQAPGGAVLDFDDDCDLSRMKLGRLLGGRLVGEVTIRGNLARGADPNDPSGELLVSTHDVQLNEEKIWTPHDVQFRMGASRGSGSDMQILLARPTADQPGKRRTMPRGIDTFQIMRDVRLVADFGGRGLLPQAKATQNGDHPPGGNPLTQGKSAPQPPVEIRCQGPFRFDMVDYVATFEDQVDVVRLNPVGPADHMTCELLAIYFSRDLKLPVATAEPGTSSPSNAAQPNEAAAAAATGAAAAAAGGSGEAPRDDLRRPGSMSVTRIEARGHPVQVRAPSSAAEARGEHLEYKVQTGGLMIEGDQPVWLHYGPHEITARLVRYTPGLDGQVAEVLADGAGQLSAALPNDPARKLTATWTRQMSLRPHEGKQLISVLGDAHIAYAEHGALSGDEVWLWLLQLPPDTTAQGPPPVRQVNAPSGPSGPLAGGHNAPRMQPHSLLARGKVQVDSPQLSGRTDQLELWFQNVVDGTPPQRGSPIAPGPAAGSGASSAPAKSPAHYEMQGRLTRVQLFLRGQQVGVRDVAISGNVSLLEQPPEGSADKPLRLSGDEVQLLAADTNATTLTVSGKPAHVEARGLGLTGNSIQLDKSINRLWIDGTGETTLPLGGPPGGRAEAMGLSLAVRFARGFSFDGRMAEFNGDVIAYSDRQRLDTSRMTVQLVAPIDFSRPQPHQRPQVQQITCIGGVRMENRTVQDERVVGIDHMQTDDLTIDQVSGDLRATGPGWVSTVRAQKATAPILGGARPAAGAPVATPDDSRLSYLKVRFQQGITGNLHRREMTFADQVTCVYGPVSQWTDEIDTIRAADLTPQQVMLTCDRLTANDLGTGNAGAGEPLGNPAGGLLGGGLVGGGRAVELQASGNARIEGQNFTAQGERLTYAAEKQLIVLEGAGQADAHLWQQRASGEPSSHAVARKMLYWRATNRVQVIDGRTLDLNQVGRSP